jgi:adenylate cyclase
MNVEIESKTKTEPLVSPARSKVKQWLIALMVLVLVEALVMLGVFSRTEMAIYDTWFRLHGSSNPGQEIVIAAIDNSSIDRIGPLAWPRSVHASLLEKLQQARVVAFDLTFDSAQDQKEDQAFGSAVAQHGNVVLASKAAFEKDENGDVVQEMVHPIDVLMEGANGVGFVNTPSDADHVVRRLSLVDVNTYSIPFPSFDLAVAIASEGLNPQDIKVKNNLLGIGSHHIPVDSLNQAMPAFWGPAATFTTVHYADIIEGKIAPSFFQDKIVLVGSTTQEEHDTYPTPFTTTNMVLTGAPPTPGVEIHAAAINSILTNTWYRQAGTGLNLLFLISWPY